MEKKNKGTGLAVTSMILGIVGLVTSCVAVGGILCIVGLIFSIPALVRSRSGIAVAGLVTSIIGTIFFILTLSGIEYMDSLMDRAHENRTQTESSVDDKESKDQTAKEDGNQSTDPTTAPASSAAPAKKKKTKEEKYASYAEQIQIEVYDKRNIPADYTAGRFQEFIELDYKVVNKCPKSIKGIKGTLDIYDQFDEHIISMKWDTSDTIKANETKEFINTGINYNQFIDSHKKLHSLKYKDLTFRYEAKQINFSDGYKLRL